MSTFDTLPGESNAHIISPIINFVRRKRGKSFGIPM